MSTQLKLYSFNPVLITAIVLSCCFCLTLSAHVAAASLATPDVPMQNDDATSDLTPLSPTANNTATLKTAPLTEDQIIRIGFFYLETTVSELGFTGLHNALTDRISQANQILKNSGITGEFRFNHLSAWPHANHAQFSDNDAQTTYNEMDATIQSLHHSGYLAHRGIDIALLVDYRINDPYCGWASINSLADLQNRTRNRNYGLIRLGPGCGLRSLALIHELGHIFGAAHGLDETVSPSDPRGHGFECDNNYTVMHTRHAKHLFFSSPWKIAASEMCGANGQADVSAMIQERFPLLATYSPARATPAKVTLRAEEIDGALKLTFERFGWVDADAQLDFYLTGENITTAETLTQIRFEPGELVKSISIPATTLASGNLLLLNPKNIALPYYQVQLSTLGSDTAVPLAYRLSGNTLSLELNADMTNWTAAEIAWGDETSTPISTVTRDLTAADIYSHDYTAPGIYEVSITGYDPQGQFQTRTLTVDLTPPASSTGSGLSAAQASQFSEAPSASDTGAGSLHSALLIFWLGLLFRMRLSDQKASQQTCH